MLRISSLSCRARARNPAWMLLVVMPYLITFRKALPSTLQGVAEEKFTP